MEESKLKGMTQSLRAFYSDEEVSEYLKWIIKSDTTKKYWEKTIERSKVIDILDAYSKFLEEHGYVDSDWKTEEPFAIDEFLKTYEKN